jgi:hypothetical protein
VVFLLAQTGIFHIHFTATLLYNSSPVIRDFSYNILCPGSAIPLGLFSNRISNPSRKLKLLFFGLVVEIAKFGLLEEAVKKAKQ